MSQFEIFIFVPHFVEWHIDLVLRAACGKNTPWRKFIIAYPVLEIASDNPNTLQRSGSESNDDQRSSPPVTEAATNSKKSTKHDEQQLPASTAPRALGNDQLNWTRIGSGNRIVKWENVKFSFFDHHYTYSLEWAAAQGNVRR